MAFQAAIAWNLCQNQTVATCTDTRLPERRPTSFRRSVPPIASNADSLNTVRIRCNPLESPACHHNAN